MTAGNLALQNDAGREHILFHHNDTDGWIAMARKNPITQGFQQYHYRIEDLINHLSEWTGEDVYFSQGSFLSFSIQAIPAAKGTALIQ